MGLTVMVVVVVMTIARQQCETLKWGSARLKRQEGLLDLARLSQMNVRLDRLGFPQQQQQHGRNAAE